MICDNIQPDRPARAFAIAGVLVGTVALFGFNLASPTPARLHKSPSSIAHVVAPANNAALVITPALGCSVFVLALLLWLGRQSVDGLRRIQSVEPARVAGSQTNSPALRSRLSISYHSGGLYGP